MKTNIQILEAKMHRKYPMSMQTINDALDCLIRNDGIVTCGYIMTQELSNDYSIATAEISLFAQLLYAKGFSININRSISHVKLFYNGNNHYANRCFRIYICLDNAIKVKDKNECEFVLYSASKPFKIEAELGSLERPLPGWEGGKDLEIKMES